MEPIHTIPISMFGQYMDENIFKFISCFLDIIYSECHKKLIDIEIDEALSSMKVVLKLENESQDRLYCI